MTSDAPSDPSLLPNQKARQVDGANGRTQFLEELIEHAAHLLPAQGPIPIFVHHNTLHAFEGLPFEEAVVRAGELFGCEPFLPEDHYRAEIARGRILEHDIHQVLSEDLGAAGKDRIGPWGTRFEIRLAILRKGIPRLAGPELRWILSELGVLERLRRDLDPEPRRLLIERTRSTLGRDIPLRRLERILVSDLSEACRQAVSRVPAVPVDRGAPLRHRDLFKAVTGVDSDALVHPFLIRLCGAFLDQGVAYWPMLGRDLGFYKGFLRLYGQKGRGPRDPWLGGLGAELLVETSLQDDLESAVRSLEILGVPEGEWNRFVTETLLALRGWAGMIRQIEIRPDRVPVFAPPVSLSGFLAVHLVLERLALGYLARQHLGFDRPLAELREFLHPRLPNPGSPSLDERAAPLFLLAQLLGRGPAEVRRLTPGQTSSLLDEIEEFSSLKQRRLLHLAFERRHRVEILDSITTHLKNPPALEQEPAFQAIFCMDDREESFRRHLEEVDPGCETYGIAGYFGVAMYYRGAGDAHSRALCPITIKPQNEVVERIEAKHRVEARFRARSRRTLGRLIRGINISSRSLARGTLLTAFLGALFAIPLVIRVLFPRLAARFRHSTEGLLEPPEETFLSLNRRRMATPSLGTYSGFTKEEMAEVVKGQLEDIGLSRGFAPVVLVVGHGSSSLNNPHESAYDCGACGGGKGGPNARAFALMANDPAVRDLLAASGLRIPSSTWFIAAFHNTCNDSISYFDADDIPEGPRASAQRAMAAFEEARARNAHERCRRFDRVPSWFTPAMALTHAERRAEDLAQPRPECGHATNAVAFIGRRSRTRSLFLDRRAFLVSYDPAEDDSAGRILARLLASVGPVGAGINLEYYFSYVDARGYGAGTKLPHNLTGFIGVMDGHASDLRTGLPWQMVELHEPVRLLLIIETTPEIISRLASENPAIGRLVKNRWVQLSLLDPDSSQIQVYQNGVFSPYEPESEDLAIVPSSIEWYRGRRAHLPCARVGTAPFDMRT